jgi:M6 family metalloprotease-like protein
MKKPYQIPLLLASTLLLSGCVNAASSPVASSLLTSASSLPSTSSAVSSSAAPIYNTFDSLTNVHDLGLADHTHYLPAKGSDHILVIPIVIKGYESQANSALHDAITKAFFGKSSDTGWESLASYYQKSSFGQLSLDGTVSDFYECGLTPKDIQGSASGINGTNVNRLLDNAVEWYRETSGSSLNEFDSDNDGYLDGVWFLYTCPTYREDSSLGASFWAFTSWMGGAPSLTKPGIDTYGWASTSFLFEGYGTEIDAHTLIHETGHMLGLEDYYDYDDKACPMGKIDMMDYNIIDHNAWSKFAFGWVSPYVADKAGTITLRPSATSGDCLLLPTGNGWNGSVFDEYLLVEFYTPENLNYQDSIVGYSPRESIGSLSESGLRIYHVDARLATSSGGTYAYSKKIVANKTTVTNLAHSNTASMNRLDSSFRLIQELDCTEKRNFASGPYGAKNSSLFQSGNRFVPSAFSASFPRKTLANDGSAFPYALSVGSIDKEGIRVTVSEA